MALIASPTSASFNSLGGACDVYLRNVGSSKIVFKVRCSNNTNYRITPVFAFIDPSCSAVLKITRSAGTVKNDKIVVQYGIAPTGCTDPNMGFTSAVQPIQNLTIPLYVNYQKPAAPAEESAPTPVPMSMRPGQQTPGGAATTPGPAPSKIDSTRNEKLYCPVVENAGNAEETAAEMNPTGANTSAENKMALDTPAVVVPATGGTFEHKLNNATGSRFVFKVKSSNNTHYRVAPVYGFVEPFGCFPLKVTRMPGPPKKDKLVVHFGPASAVAYDACAAFALVASSAQLITIPLCAV